MHSPAIRSPGSFFVPTASANLPKLLRMSENAGLGMLTEVSERITSLKTCWISVGVWKIAGKTEKRSKSGSMSLGSDASWSG